MVSMMFYRSRQEFGLVIHLLPNLLDPVNPIYPMQTLGIQMKLEFYHFKDLNCPREESLILVIPTIL